MLMFVSIRVIVGNPSVSHRYTVLLQRNEVFFQPHLAGIRILRQATWLGLDPYSTSW